MMSIVKYIAAIFVSIGFVVLLDSVYNTMPVGRANIVAILLGCVCVALNILLLRNPGKHSHGTAKSR